MLTPGIYLEFKYLYGLIQTAPEPCRVADWLCKKRTLFRSQLEQGIGYGTAVGSEEKTNGRGGEI